MLSFSQSQIEGFDALHVNTGLLTLTCIPALGGKISSLRDNRSGREWLWRNPRLPYRRFPHGSGYMEADTGGWDECFPSVNACLYPSNPWLNAAIQDHGELWSQQPEFAREEHGHRIALRARWYGVALPYVFERVIWLAPEAAQLRFEYTATNTSACPMPVIWATHPLIAIEPGMRLVVPPEARFNVTAAWPEHQLEQQRGLEFPLTINGIDLATLPDRCGVALKVWSDPLVQGWATIQACDGELRLRWDAGEFTQLALWMNFGAFAGIPGEPYYNLGLEPCIGAQDAVETAVLQENVFLTLPPYSSKQWWLDVELYAS